MTTKQRQVIYEELAKLKTHPTADELFPFVRQRIPNISLATVYRNLNWLVEQGLINKIEYGSTQKRFDAKQDLHYHLRCNLCKRLWDLDKAEFVSELDAVMDDMASEEKHKIEGYNLEFYGVCKHCKEEEEK